MKKVNEILSLHKQLSINQSALLFVSKLPSSTNAYNESMLFTINQRINLNLLERSVKKIVARHETLSSYIKSENGKNFSERITDKQFIIQNVKFSNKNQMYKYIQEQANEIIHFESQFPIKVYFIFVRKQVHLFVIFHHIVMDGWSIEIFIKEMETYYKHFLSPKKNDIDPLPPIVVSYSDLVVQQAKKMRQKKFLTRIQSAKKEIINYSALSFPTDYVRPTEFDYKGENSYRIITPNLAKIIDALAIKMKVSFFAIFTAAYFIMLSAYSNQNDITIGTQTANRDLPACQQLIGYFTNAVPVRSQINFNVTASEYIKSISQNIKNAKKYKDIPFPTLVEALKLPSDLSRNPVYQTSIVFRDFKRATSGVDYQLFHSLEYFDFTAKFDLCLNIEQSINTYKVYFNYATSLFTKTTIDNIKNTYYLILQQMVTNPSIKIGKLKFVDTKDIKIIEDNFNKTKCAVPKLLSNTKTFIDYFKLQVKSNPHAHAVAFNDKVLTYKQLDDESNILANYLTSKYHLRQNGKISLIISRSEKMVVAILAVIKTGACYIPIATNAPLQRRWEIFNQVKPNLVLVDFDMDPNEYSLTSYKKTSIIPTFVNLSKLTIRKQNKLPLKNKVLSSDLVYIIFTSGTTGKPKGVMIRHLGLVNLFNFQASILGFNNKKHLKRSLFFADYTFDAHAFELYVTLSRGHCIHIASDELRNDSNQLAQYILNNKIDFATLPPVLVNASTNIFPLKTLVVAGDTSSIDKINSYIKAGTTVFNGYGPTEDTVCATIHKFTLNDPIPNNIGKPISNTKIYIVNQNNQLSPIGGFGELCITGIGLAVGYLNNKEKTNAVFIKNPFYCGVAECSRLYKTGDLVRYRTNGDIQFFGRIDSQVKVRGHRIEIEEIETALSNYPNILSSAVVVKKDNDNQQLIAYYTAKKNIKETDIVKYLSKLLPKYMLPSLYVHILKMPLNQSMKVDKKALPDPIYAKYNHKSKAPTTNDVKKPSTPTETALLNIFSRILNVPVQSISVADNFFHIGGDSIRSIQLSSIIHKELSRGINIRDIYNLNSIENIARLIDDSNKLVNMITETGRLSGPVELLPIQKYFFSQLCSKLYNSSHFNQSFSLRVESCNKKILKMALEQLLIYHDAFSLSFKKTKNGNIKQFYNNKKKMSNYIYDIDANKFTNADISKKIVKRSSSFNIFNNNTFAISIISNVRKSKLATPVTLVHFAMHHLIIDVISWHILKDNLERLYNAIATNKINPIEILGEKFTSYRQWAHFINNLPNEQPILSTTEKEYFNAFTKDIHSLNNMIIKMYNPEQHNSSTVTINHTITSRLIKDLPAKLNTKINDILLAALSKSLFVTFQMEKVFVSLESHGRQQIEDNININNTIGWFTTIHPQPLQFKQDLELLLSTTEQLTSTAPQNDFFYGALFGYDKLPKIAFNYLGQIVSDVNTLNGNFSFDQTFNDINVPVDSQEDFIINFNGSVSNGVLSFVVASQIDKENHETLVSTFKIALMEIINFFYFKSVLSNNSQKTSASAIVPTHAMVDTSPIIVLNKGDNQFFTPLFLVHTAIGGAENYYFLIQKLDPRIPIYFINNQYYSNPDNPITGIQNIAKKYIQYIKPLIKNNHISLGGWSFGGNIAYEMSVLLDAEGVIVDNIYLFDSDTMKRTNRVPNAELIIDFIKRTHNKQIFDSIKTKGLLDLTVKTYQNARINMNQYEASKYSGSIILFKGNPKNPLASTFLKGKKYNGFDKYVNVKSIKVIVLNVGHMEILENNPDLITIVNTINRTFFKSYPKIKPIIINVNSSVPSNFATKTAKKYTQLSKVKHIDD